MRSIIFAVGVAVSQAAVASAQTFEVAPVAGYRFGGGFFELVTGHPVDLDGAPSLGLALNVPLSMPEPAENSVSFSAVRLPMRTG